MSELELSDAEYEALESAVMETVRGRWFLAEHARRNRQAETKVLTSMLNRIYAAIGRERDALPDNDNLENDGSSVPETSSKWDEIRRRWPELKHRVRQHWFNLTDSDVDAIDGKRDRLIDYLELKYHLSREALEKEVEAFEFFFKATDSELEDASRRELGEDAGLPKPVGDASASGPPDDAPDVRPPTIAATEVDASHPEPSRDESASASTDDASDVPLPTIAATEVDASHSEPSRDESASGSTDDASEVPLPTIAATEVDASHAEPSADDFANGASNDASDAQLPTVPATEVDVSHAEPLGDDSANGASDDASDVRRPTIATTESD